MFLKKMQTMQSVQGWKLSTSKRVIRRNFDTDKPNADTNQKTANLEIDTRKKQ